jgi:hypothetical protein
MAKTPILEIAEPGYDIKTCGEENMVFSSRLRTLKTKTSINMTVNHEAYSHGLGYIPIHLYAGYLAAKPVVIGWVGQNNLDNSTSVIVTSTTITNDSNYEWAADALVYVFWEELA